MHLLQKIEINNYLNLKSAQLDDLMDLNVIIGPNNCGKTSTLRAIDLLRRINFGKLGNPLDCEKCESVYRNADRILALDGEIGARERFMDKHDAKIVFTFNVGEIERTLPYLTNERDEIMDDVLANPDESQILNETAQLRQSKDVDDQHRANRLADMHKRNYALKTHASTEFTEPKIVLRQNPERRLRTEHISFLINRKFREDVLQTIIFCPDARLDSYKGTSVSEYIRSKNLPASQQRVMVGFLKDFVDLKLDDVRQNMDLIRVVEDTRFDTTIAEQGSGVKSLICLVADILAGTQNKILLIDEPELGLNPAGKQAFLKFLLGQSREKQVFIATHDPTFVNPVLWDSQNVSCYLYSVIERKFVKINLKESKTDPDTFAGYLPHTTSLKKAHIYVEGSVDVYIFQIFLQKYAKENFDNWFEIINRIGIYHLAGDFWSHLLYTIPEKPYFSIVVLDGDKRELASDVIKKYDAIKKNRFMFFGSVSEMKKLSRRDKTLENDISSPVVCLERPEIEDYLEPKLAAKEYGPLVAKQMKRVPEEIEEIFSIVFRLAKMEGPKKHRPQTIP
jgi:predicted ATP-dependent endonuclease of OLD family